MIRRINSQDLPRIYELGEKYDSSFTAKYELENYLDNKLYILNCFEEENIIKGFIICTNISKTVEILLIYVDEMFRKKKIGEALLTSIERDAEEIILEVSSVNVPAISLYNKMLFKQIGVRPKYYNGVDALVMKKVLK